VVRQVARSRPRRLALILERATGATRDSGALLHTQIAAIGRSAADRREAAAVVARRVVCAGIGVYVVLFAAAAVTAYLNYDVSRFDLGDMVQAVWSTAHGRFLETTNGPGHQFSRLGSHVDPFLLFFVPLWFIWPSALMLVVVQIAAIAVGALPVFWLARKHLRSERAASYLAFAYLACPAVQFNALGLSDSVHAVSFAIPLILFAIWFLDEERLALFGVFAILAATTKEEIALSVGCLGLWYAVRHRHPVAGLMIFVLGATVTLTNFLVVIPHFSPTGANQFAGRYAAIGGTPRGVLHTFVSNPAAIFDTVATRHKLVYAALLLVPFLGLWMLEPLLFLGALPDLAINLLSSKPEQTQIYYQYSAGIAPFVVAASILAISKIRRRPDRVSFAVLLAAAALTILSPITHVASRDLSHVLHRDDLRAAKAAALAIIPSGAPVSATNDLGGRLSARRFIYTFPVRRHADWVVLSADDQVAEKHPTRFRRQVAAINANHSWRVVYRSHGVELLRRRS
jgi:uncharacterized membrane protein